MVIFEKPETMNALLKCLDLQFGIEVATKYKEKGVEHDHIPSSQMPTQIQNQPQDQLNQVNNNVFLSQSDQNKEEVQINIKNIADNIVADEYCIQSKHSIYQQVG